MPDWPGASGLDRISRALSVGDDYVKTSLGGHPGVINTKGTWFTMIASTPFDAHGFQFSLSNSNGNAWSALIDIAIGSSGNETIIVENLAVHLLVNDNLAEFFWFPLAIPAGVRVACRFQNNATGGGMTGEINLFAGGHNSPCAYGQCLTYGVNPANSLATLVTLDYPGAWVSIADNVPELQAIIAACYLDGLTSNPLVGFYELAYSAAGAGSPSYPLLPSIPIAARTSQQSMRFSVGALPLRVPDNSRIWARGMGAGYANQKVRLAVYGFR